MTASYESHLDLKITPDLGGWIEVDGGWCRAIIELAVPAEAAAPVIAARRCGRLLTFWCAWCKRWHLHGGPGHRIAHCVNPDSPYWSSGYVLVEATA